MAIEINNSAGGGGGGGFMAFEIKSSLHNYNTVCQGAVHSEVVSAGGHCWRLACYPHGDPRHVPGPYQFISIYLELLSKPVAAFTATFAAFAAHGDGSPPSHHAQCRHLYTPGGNRRTFKRACGLPEFIGNYTEIPVERGLAVMWRVRVTRENETGMGRQLGRLLDPKLAAWTDVSFVVAGETFRAHRAVVAARSPVFEAELFGDMLESSAASITLHDIEPDTFRTMLRFIYTDALPITAEDEDPPNLEALRRLLAAADRFALDGLKLACGRRMLDGVSVDTVVDVLRWADTYNCGELREECAGFVAAERNFNDVVLSVGFTHLVLESPSILDDVKESARRLKQAKESLEEDESRKNHGRRMNLGIPYQNYQNWD